MQNETSHGSSPLRNRYINDSIRCRFGFLTVVPWHSGGATIALRDALWKPALETSCYLCCRGCVCLIGQWPCAGYRLSPQTQIHNLTCSKIEAFFMKFATVIPIQLCPISGFRGDYSFAIPLDIWRFLFWVQYKTFFECCLVLFRCLLLRVLFYFVQFLDSLAIPLFCIAIV